MINCCLNYLFQVQRIKEYNFFRLLLNAFLIVQFLSQRLAREMVSNGEAPPRGSAAAAASLRKRRTGGGRANALAGGAASTMLQFYIDDTTGHKISPRTVLVMSVGFIAVVALMHVFGKLYLIHT